MTPRPNIATNLPMHVQIPINTARHALTALYLLSRSGGGTEYEEAHNEIIKSINNNVKFDKEESFNVEITKTELVVLKNIL